MKYCIEPVPAFAVGNPRRSIMSRRARRFPLNNHRVFAVLLAVALGVGVSLGQVTSAQPPVKAAPNPFLRIFGNGAWWTSLPDDAKDTFVDGYITAMSRVHDMLARLCTEEAKNLKTGAQFEADMKTALNECVDAEFFDFSVDERLDRQKVRNGIDEFYKDSQNARIPIDFAMEYVKDVLKGRKAPRELEDQLKGWRSSPNK
jgi:hypothetical protein